MWRWNWNRGGIRMQFAAGAGTGLEGGAGSGGAPPAGGGAGAGTGSGTGAGTGTGSGAGVAPGAGSGAGAGAGVADSPNIRQLREQYETLKKQHDTYSTLGKPEELQTSHAVYQAIFTQAREIGSSLGYPDDEIVEALQLDPVKTLDFLRAEAQGAGGGGDDDPEAALMNRVESALEERLAPIYEQENVRRTDEANAVFQRTVYTEIGEYLKKEGVDIAQADKNEINALINVTSEMMKYDEAAMKALKFEGKTAGVKVALQQALQLMDAYYTARSSRERAKVGAGAGGNRGAGPGTGKGAGPGVDGKKPTIDEIIDNPGLINKKYA